MIDFSTFDHIESCSAWDRHLHFHSWLQNCCEDIPNVVSLCVDLHVSSNLLHIYLCPDFKSKHKYDSDTSNDNNRNV